MSLRRRLRARLCLEVLEDRCVPATFTVTTAATTVNPSDGVLSLYEAVALANSTPNVNDVPDRIEFNLTTSDPQFNPNSGPAGAWTIDYLNSAFRLPHITEAVVLDGYTQPGSSPNTLAVGNNAVLRIEINDFLSFEGNGSTRGSTVRGLVLRSLDLGRDGSGGFVSGHTIEGNFIGTNVAGTAAVSSYGIQIHAGRCSGTVIGGAAPEARNLISGAGSTGNAGIAIFSFSQAGTGFVIRNNYIGTNAAGTAAVANRVGIAVSGADGTVIEDNLISGNTGEGVLLGRDFHNPDLPPTTNTILRRNTIGANALGTAGVPNLKDGIQILYNTSGTQIGGTTPGDGNSVAFNGSFFFGGGDGVRWTSLPSSDTVAILGNSIFNNSGLGINNFLDGAGRPVLNSVALNNGTLTASYRVPNRATPPTTYPLRVEFFKADSAGQEGQVYLGFADYTSADAGLDKTITLVVGNALAAGDRVVATASEANGTTSEFSVAGMLPPPPATFVVTTTADTVNANDGLLSLREAILAANSTPNVNGTPDRIEFNVPTSDAGYNAANGPAGAWTFRPTSGQALPTVTEAVVIDGYSQPGTSPNTQATSDDAVLRIELKGQPVFSTPVLRLGSGSSGSSLRGLVINTVNTGIQVDSDNNTFAGNFIGTSVTALAETGFGAVVYEVALRVNGSGNTIGGVTPAERNLIFGQQEGVLLNAAHNTRIQGNFIGINRTGTADIIPIGDFGSEGILVNGSNNVTIGGTVAGAGNVISGAIFEGINFEEMGVGNRVQGNLIGTNATGTAAIPNGGDGIAVGGGSAGASFLIGGSEPGARNVISGNVGAGILLGHTAGTVLVQGNLIGPDITGTNPIVLSGVVGRQFVGVFARGSGTGDTIGGVNPGEGNIIAFNGFAGVYVQGNRSGVAILGNSMYSNLIPNADNVVLGIDIGPTNGTTGFTPNPNDGGDGDGIAGLNRLQNSPVLTSATLLDEIVSLQYAVDSLPTFSPYPLRIEFFKADADGQEGQTYLGFSVYTAPAATQEVLFDLAPAVAVSPGDKIVATATTADGHTSEFSAFIVVQEPAPTLPAAPSDLIVSNFTTTTVSFLWTDNADNETAYEIERAVGLDATDFQPVAASPFAADTTNHTETGLTPGAIYYFRVRAVNAAGASDWLTSGNIPLLDVAPAAPTNLMLTGTTASSVSLSWIDNASNETRYEIEQAVGAGSANFESVFGGPFPPDTTSHTVIALASGVTYRFRVRAVNSGGVSDWLTSDDILVPIATTTTLASNQNPVAVGQEVTFTAFVNAGGVNPGGTVTFRAGNQVLGTAPVLGNAVATLTTSFPTTGAQVVTAVYEGNVPFLTSFSDPLVQTVGSSDLAVSVEGSDRVELGSTVVVRITVTNNGPDTVSGIVLTDTIGRVPPALTPDFLFVSAFDDAGNEFAIDVNGVVTCPLGTLAAGASATVSVEVTPTEQTLGGFLRHLVTATGDQGDLDPNNNTAELRTVVTRATPVIRPGEPDRSFGQNGRTTVDIPFARDFFNAVAVQADGKIVAVGSTQGMGAAQRHIVVARFHPDGSPDVSFGTSGNGRVLLLLLDGTQQANAVAIQPDGKILVGGGVRPREAGPVVRPDETYFALVRLNPNGTLDNSFGSLGQVVTHAGASLDVLGSSEIRALVLQPDGKILAVGSTWRTVGTLQSYMAVVRYNPDGSLDGSFGTRTSQSSPGRTVVRLSSQSRAVAAALQPDGKILLAGSNFVPETGITSFLAARLNPDGLLDTSFDADGFVTTLGSSEVANAVAVQPDGNILVAGTVADDFVLVRYRPDGSLDRSFSHDGRALFDFGVPAALTSLVLFPNGKILAGGSTLSSFALVRFHTNGSVDDAFGQFGRTTTRFPEGTSALAGLALQTDGKIVAAGSVGTLDAVRFALARYHGDPLDILVTGADPGGPPLVRVYDAATGLERFNLLAYGPAFRGGVRVATADVNGDLVPDVITAPGPGVEPRVKVFDGVTGVQLPGAVGSFLAYERRFHGGVFVAAGDVNGDGRADIVTGPGSGLEPRVKVFDALLATPLAGPRGNFLAYNPGFKGGVTVATGDLNGDGTPDLITGAGPGGFGVVKSFDGLTGQQFPRPLGQLTAFGATHRGGVMVASGDVNGDGRDDIIIAAGAAASTPPRVQVFNGLDGRVLADFFAYDEAFRGGVNVAAGDVNGDGRAEIITGAGRGKGQHVRLFELTLTEIDNFFADELDFTGGVYVAASRTRRR